MREEVKQALNLLLKRLLISLPFIAIGVWLFIPYSITSFFALVPFTIVGALLTGPLTSLFCQPAGSLFNPRPGRREPHLALSLPESRIMDGKYDEALKQYREMLEVDPQRLEIWIRILELAFKHMKQPEAAHEVFSRGMKVISRLPDRELLCKEYQRFRAQYRENR